MRICLGTRRSKLALKQAEIVKAELLKVDLNLQFEIKEIVTTGDINLEDNLYESGGKGLFLKEIEEALLKDEIDIAVHSLKDVPAELPQGLEICTVLKREDPRDAFISTKYASIWDLPEGAVVGTSSPRRKIQLLQMRQDLKIVNFRGNVNTRLEKIEKHEVDATVLAIAGLKRLSIDKSFQVFDVDQILPAIGQGALCIEKKKSNTTLDALLKQINDPTTWLEIQAERKFMSLFNASCNTPIAAFACIVNDEMVFKCMYHDVTTGRTSYSWQSGAVSEAEKLVERGFKDCSE